MTLNEKDELKLSLLQMEYSKCYEKILYTDEQSNKAIESIFIAVGVLVAICGYAFSNWLPIPGFRPMTFFIFCMGTVILNFLLLHAFHMIVLCFLSGGYMKHLEKRINTLMKENILVWELQICPKYIHRSSISVFQFLIVGLLYLTLSAFGVYYVIVELIPYNLIFAIIILSFIVLEFAAMIATANEAKKAHSQVFDICEQVSSSSETCE